MLTEDLKIYKDMYDLTKFIVEAKHNFSREHKYDLGNRLLDKAVECCELVQCANSDKSQRVAYLQDFARCFGSLRLYLRLCRDFGQIPNDKFGRVLELTAEIGKQCTAWRKSASAKSRSHSGQGGYE